MEEWGSSVGNGFVVKNYAEFRRIAHNPKVVFSIKITSTSGKMHSNFNGAIIEYIAEFAEPF
ncbi:MAG: hypothetical protein ACFFDT_11975 [Candidatus Hodarchaeota archaeon]